MYPSLSEAMVRIRIEELHREAALYRLAYEGRARRRRALRSSSRAAKEATSRPEVSSHASSAETCAASIESSTS
jgi:hypothetical protein